MASKKKKKKTPTITCGGYSIEQNLRANAEALRMAKSRDSQVEVLNCVKAAFDRNCVRARDLHMLSCASSTTTEEREFLDKVRDGHTRLAIGHAKMIWRVE